jgi:predicted anti-sigma-YlaC factor YlaD
VGDCCVRSRRDKTRIDRHVEVCEEVRASVRMVGRWARESRRERKVVGKVQESRLSPY